MKVSEENQSDELRRCKQVLSGSNIATWEWNVQTGETIFNERWAEIIGFQLSDIAPISIETWIQFTHPEDLEKSNQLLNAHFKGETDNYVCEARMRHKKGHWVWVLDQGQVVSRTTDGEPEWVVGSHLEITDLKNAELRLRLSERAFRESFHNAAVGMAILDTEGRWKEVNKTLCGILGYETAEFKELTFQELTHPEDLNKDLNLVHQILRGEIPFYHMEKRYFHKSGRIVHAILAVSLVRDDHGNPLHFISQIIDISQRVEAERERMALLDLTKDNNERLQNFAHVVTHDLRSHSGNIRGLMELLLSERNELENDDFFGLLQTASDNLADTIERLSEAINTNATAEENLESLDLNAVVKTCIENTAAMARELDIDISADIPENLKVLALPAYLESIVLNLVTNAIRYSSPKRKSTVQLSAALNSDFVLLAVKDNGLGIDLEHNRSQLFKLHQTFHDHPDSRGIGLFITRNQIEAMGGRIEVESELDAGTTFKVFLRKSRDD